MLDRAEKAVVGDVPARLLEPHMRIGAVLVGFGRWGENLARVLAGSSRFELAAIVDVDPGRRQVAAARHPGVMVLADIEEALDLSGVAAAALATPPLTLQRLAHISIAKHKHVFIEKPVARTPAEVLELAEKARRAGVMLLADVPAVWSPFQDVMRLVFSQNAIGTLISWRAERTNQCDGQSGIDVLRDLAIHDLAVIDGLLHPGPTGIMACGVKSASDGRLDTVRINLFYADHRPVVEIVASWSGAQRRRLTQVIGSVATLVRDDETDGAGLRIIPALAGQQTEQGRHVLVEPAPRVGSCAEPLARSVNGFADQIEHGKSVPTTAETIARLLRWIEAAERSIATGGQPIDITRST
jgi:predicted dehydrogenase